MTNIDDYKRAMTFEKTILTCDCKECLGNRNYIARGFLVGLSSGRDEQSALIASLTARIEAQAELLRARAEKPGV